MNDNASISTRVRLRRPAQLVLALALLAALLPASATAAPVWSGACSPSPSSARLDANGRYKVLAQREPRTLRYRVEDRAKGIVRTDDMVIRQWHCVDRNPATKQVRVAYQVHIPSVDVDVCRIEVDIEVRAPGGAKPVKSTVSRQCDPRFSKPALKVAFLDQMLTKVPRGSVIRVNSRVYARVPGGTFHSERRYAAESDTLTEKSVTIPR